MPLRDVVGRRPGLLILSLFLLGRKPALFILAVFLFLLGCSGELLEQAGSSYRQRKDCASLHAVYKCLHNGMPRREVQRLLGEPDYSPIEGQEYYASNQREQLPDGRRQATLTLVVDYRSKQGAPTDELHAFWLGAVGE